MRSPWLKLALFGLIAYGLFYVYRFISERPDSINTTMTATRLYEVFQNDPRNAATTYGNNFVTVKGKVCRVIGGKNPTSVMIVGPEDNCGRYGMVECILNQDRGYKDYDFYESQPISLTGWLARNQQSGLVVVRNCRVTTI